MDQFFCLRYFEGRGSIFLELELRSDGRLRYARDGGRCIRWEAYVADIVVQQTRANVEAWGILRQRPQDWPLPRPDCGWQELEVTIGRGTVFLSAQKIETSREAVSRHLLNFYLTTQSLKTALVSIIELHMGWQGLTSWGNANPVSFTSESTGHDNGICSELARHAHRPFPECLPERYVGAKGHFVTFQHEEPLGPPKSYEGWVVIVSGVRTEVLEDDLCTHFMRFGDIRKVLVSGACTRKGFCFVVYSTQEEASAAIAANNGRVLDLISDKAVDVEWAFRQES